MTVSNSTTPTTQLSQTELLPIVVVGHVDHGKSTVIGRLLTDTDSLPQGKLEQVKANCQKNSKPFEYAFLIDALKDEQAQGITIDSARVFFKTQKRKYIIIDAPGHIEFLKNMVTGAARAEAALLVIDAKEGIRENSKRHGYLLSMLGIRQVVVVMNKMDLVDYSEKVFDQLVDEFQKFLLKVDIEPVVFIPADARQGGMIVERLAQMEWYQGPTVLEALDRLESGISNKQLPFRMPVQDVYKFTNFGDDRRIIAGTVASGQISVGDEIVFYPSGKKSIVAGIERFSAPQKTQASSGEAVGLTLADQVYVRRGDVAVLSHESAPKVSSRVKANIFWLGKDDLCKSKRYVLKIGTAKTVCWVEEILKMIDAVDLTEHFGGERVLRHQAAEVVLCLERAVAFDRIDLTKETGRFVLVDGYHIAGGGIILEGFEDQFEQFRDEAFYRNYKWIKSDIAQEQRKERYGQQPRLILITGEAGERRKDIARALEKKLFEQGRLVYFLGIGNVIHGVDADIQDQEGMGQEHLRRLAEVANLMLDAGMILIVTGIEFSQNDLNVIQAIVDSDLIKVVWIGNNSKPDISYDLRIPLEMSDLQGMEEIREKLI